MPPKLLAWIRFLYKVVPKIDRLRKVNHAQEIEFNFLPLRLSLWNLAHLFFMFMATKMPQIFLFFAKGLSYGLSKSKKLGKIITKLWKIMNHFQRLNEVKELKIFFFVQRANTRSRHRAGNRCHAMPWRQQCRTAQARGERMTRHHAEDQQLNNCLYLTSRDHRGSLSKRRELVLSSLPTRPPFFRRFSAPVSKVVCLISLYLLSTCMYHTFSHITFLGYNHMNSRASVFLDSLLSEHIIRYHMCLWGGSFQVTAHGFPPKGLLLSGKRDCSRRPHQG